MASLITYPGDLYLPPLDLWLDPGRVRDTAFISHAHADHMGRHKCILASIHTARLVTHRLQVPIAYALEYGKPLPLKHGSITLFPSGHILGAAQALIECEGERLVYTGDFKLKPSRTAEPCKIIPCDHLVMECTYGRPHYLFPDRGEVEAAMLHYLREQLEQGYVPTIMAYMLGRAQELIKLLCDEGFAVAVENRIFDMSQVYEELGVSLGNFERFDPEDYEGKVLLFPPHLWKSPVVRNIRRRKTIAVTGWAVDGRQQAWYTTDAAFALSDHADFDDLLRYIDEAAPRRVTLIHGFKEFADHLQGKGIKVECPAGLIA